ncbi:MAG: LysM peptidoglycan-binding domain-containing protein [Chloroflexi bacterium]|nr:LysM peptidoglycan-binding domain-containing protein [Chloroflexota bacterium]
MHTRIAYYVLRILSSSTKLFNNQATQYAIRYAKGLQVAALFITALWLAACGQLITKPTPSPPTNTPTSTPLPTSTPTPATPATPTPEPYTPAPTPTPTISPTPIVHAVQSGETLIAIAQRYGVSVSAIQEANGIINPRALRVGQQLFIPTEPNAQILSGSPTPTPTPLPVKIGELYFGNQPGRGLWALGEVMNSGETPLEGVTIEIALLDPSGSALITDTALAALELLDPGDRSPFGVLFTQRPDAFDAYKTRIISAAPAPLALYYRDLEVTNIVRESRRYRVESVRGIVRNIGPEDAVGVYVVVTLYDALEQVVGFRRLAPEHNVIAPGGETHFEIDIIPLGGPVTRVEVAAGARRALTPTPTP